MVIKENSAAFSQNTINLCNQCYLCEKNLRGANQMPEGLNWQAYNGQILPTSQKSVNHVCQF